MRDVLAKHRRPVFLNRLKVKDLLRARRANIKIRKWPNRRRNISETIAFWELAKAQGFEAGLLLGFLNVTIYVRQ